MMYVGVALVSFSIGVITKAIEGWMWDRRLENYKKETKKC